MSRGPRTPAPGPLLQRRETRCRDRIPVTRFMLFEQAVAHQKRDAALTNLDRRGSPYRAFVTVAFSQAFCGFAGYPLTIFPGFRNHG